MNEDNPFNTPGEEVKRLIEEVREAKEALRDVSKRLSQIEVRIQRTFPLLIPKKGRGTRERVPGAAAEPTITPEQAIRAYDEMVELARKDDHQSVHDRLASLGLGDLNLLRLELGASIGKKKPSRRVLEEAIIGRIRESVLLSRHSNRQKALAQADTVGDRVPEKDENN
jgi:hypothetical protein